MSRQNPDDLMSAYFDRELDADEQAAAEKKLLSSPESQQELDDYGRLSELLQAIPAATLPNEFQAEVMHAAERATLLPPSNEAATKPKSRSRTIWTCVGLMASVAFICVMIEAFPQSSTTPEITVLNDTAKNANLGVGESDKIVSLDLPGASNAKQGSAPAIQAVTVQKKFSEPLVFDESIGRAQVGDVVKAVDSSKNQVTVVRLTVIDRRQGLESLQMLLRENKIPMTQRQSTSAELLENQDGRFMAVYVQSDRNLMTATLETIKTKFIGVSIDGVIEVAKLDKTLQSQIASRSVGFELENVAKNSGSKFKTIESAAATAEKKKIAKQPKSSPAPRPDRTNSGQKSMADSKADSSAAGSGKIANKYRDGQLTVSVPSEFAKSRNRRFRPQQSNLENNPTDKLDAKIASAKSSKNESFGGIGGGGFADGNKQTDADFMRQTVHVLFVFVEKPDAAKQRASKSKKKAISEPTLKSKAKPNDGKC